LFSSSDADSCRRKEAKLKPVSPGCQKKLGGVEDSRPLLVDPLRGTGTRKTRAGIKSVT